MVMPAPSPFASISVEHIDFDFDGKADSAVFNITREKSGEYTVQGSYQPAKGGRRIDLDKYETGGYNYRQQLSKNEEFFIIDMGFGDVPVGSPSFYDHQRNVIRLRGLASNETCKLMLTSGVTAGDCEPGKQNSEDCAMSELMRSAHPDPNTHVITKVNAHGQPTVSPYAKVDVDGNGILDIVFYEDSLCMGKAVFWEVLFNPQQNDIDLIPQK